MKITKILLDTTYLLPLFEIKTEKFSKNDLKRLLKMNVELYYNPVSLIEIKWKIIKLCKRNRSKLKYMRKVYNETLEYLQTTDELIPTEIITKEISVLDDILFDAGIRDFFDRIIVATAEIFTGVLLTEDEELRDIPMKLDEFRDLLIISWNELQEIMKRKNQK